MNDKLVECLECFSSIPVFKRLLNGFQEKYASFGSVSGTVLLEVSMEDIEVLNGFFNKRYNGKSQVRISANQMKYMLKDSRFSEISMEELLYAYCNGELISKKEQREKQEQKKQELFEQLISKYVKTPVANWLNAVSQEHGTVYLMILKACQVNLSDTYTDYHISALLSMVLKALNELPCYENRLEYLAVFASRISKDPHYFDEGNEAFTLFWYGLTYLFQKEKNHSEEIFPTFQKQELLLSAGILKDDISNYTTIYGIQAWNDNQERHRGIDGFYQQQESMQLPLSTIVQIRQVESSFQKIYVVENPSVYSVLQNAYKENAYMCLRGQPNLSSIRMLDLLAESGVTIYYAGDFDPEGLWIAQRLKRRYQEKLILWLMDEETYEKAMTEVTLTPKRLKMLDLLTDDCLCQVAIHMRDKKSAGYQENVLKEYLHFIQTEGN